MIEFCTDSIILLSFKFWKNDYSEEDVIKYLNYAERFFKNSPYDITIKVFTKHNYYYVLFKMLKKRN